MVDNVFGPNEVPIDFHFNGGCYVRIFGFSPNSVGSMSITPDDNMKVLFQFNQIKPASVPRFPTTGTGGREWVFGAVIDVKGFHGKDKPSIKLNLANTLDPRLLQAQCVDFSLDSRLGNPTSINFRDIAGNNAGGFFGNTHFVFPDITIDSSGLLLGENLPGAGGIVPPTGNKSGLWFSNGVDGTYPSSTGVIGNGGIVPPQSCSVTVFSRSSGVDFAFDLTVYEKQAKAKPAPNTLPGITKDQAIAAGLADSLGNSLRGLPSEIITNIVAQNRVRNLGNAVPITSGAVDVFLEKNDSLRCWLGGNTDDLYRMVRFDPRTNAQLTDTGSLAFGSVPPKYPPIITPPGG